tara:strand:+ start:279 stop:413 length:135 start_codon:yes stop_codon:yes gene_type:complete
MRTWGMTLVSGLKDQPNRRMAVPGKRNAPAREKTVSLKALGRCP